MDVRVIDLRCVDGGRTLKATVDVEVAGLVIVRELKVIESSKGTFVVWPSRPWIAKDGQKHYSTIVEPVSRELREAVKEAVLSQYTKKAT